MRGRWLVCQAGLLLLVAPLPAQQGVLLKDSFATDTRAAFSIEGGVQWKKNQLTLGEGARVVRKLEAGAEGFLTIKLALPVADAAGAEARLAVELIMAGTGARWLEHPRQGPERFDQPGVRVLFTRRRDKDKVASYLAVEQFSIDPSTGLTRIMPLRQVALPDLGNPFTCTLSYRYGLVEVQHEGTLVAMGMATFRARPIVGVALAQRSGQAIWTNFCFQANTAPAALTAADKTDLQQAADLIAREAKLLSGSKEALKLLEQARDIHRRVLGDTAPATLSSLNNVAHAMIEARDASAALKLFETCLAAKRKLFGENHLDTAIGWHNVGFALKEIGEPTQARQCYEKALAIFRRVDEPRSPRLLTAVRNLSELCLQTGDRAAATALRKEHLDLLIQSPDRTVAQMVDSLHELGHKYYLGGDLGGAHRCWNQGLALCLKELPADWRRAARHNNSLGVLATDIGDYANAARHLQGALKTYESNLGPNQADTALVLQNLGYLCNAAGDNHGAAVYYERALEVFRLTEGERGEQTVNTTQNLAILLSVKDHYKQALRMLEQALMVREQDLGLDHPYTLRTMMNIAGMHKRAGHLDKAQRLYEQVVGVRRKSLGTHPDTAHGLGKLGEFHFEFGDLEAAMQCYREAFAMELQLAGDLLPGLAEVEAFAYVRAAASSRDPLLNLMRARGPDEALKAYKVVWDTRALATRALSARKWAASRDPRLQLLQHLRTQLAQLYHAPPSTGKPEAVRERLKDLILRKEALERELAQAGIAAAPLSVDPAALRALLPEDVAVVEFAETVVQERNAKGKGLTEPVVCYDAFVLRRSMDPQMPAVTWMRLGSAEPIDNAVGRWGTVLLREKSEGAGRIPHAKLKPHAKDVCDGALRALIWDKIEPHLKGCKYVLILSDGSLARVPWPALPGKTPGTFLVEEYGIATAASGQQLHALLAQAPPQGRKCLLVADVDYDTPPLKPQGTSVGAGPLGAGRQPPAGKRGMWQPLNSATEAKEIARLWHAGPGNNAPKSDFVFLKGAAASEGALVEELPGARFVHLATHGFFADRKFRSALQHHIERERLLPADFDVGGRATVAGRNPLLLSGLVLAGANKLPRLDELGLPAGPDGILTAEEIGDLDLNHNDLIVLSACDTGLGEVAGGEGVLGLQRAFGLAGARTVIASLWAVEDSATVALMTELYKNLWDGEHGKLAALRRAQVRLLRDYDPETRQMLPPGERTDALHPLYWAGFSLSGDWR
jgi:CHAT domain-containing protein/tetratricopeptide (TPR) repeat protein